MGRGMCWIGKGLSEPGFGGTCLPAGRLLGFIGYKGYKMFLKMVFTLSFSYTQTPITAGSRHCEGCLNEHSIIIGDDGRPTQSDSITIYYVFDDSSFAGITIRTLSFLIQYRNNLVIIHLCPFCRTADTNDTQLAKLRKCADQVKNTPSWCVPS